MTNDTEEMPYPSHYAPDDVMISRLNRDFTFHPARPDQAERYEQIRAKARAFAEYLCHHSPKSREQSLALTAIEEAVFWTNAAIARNEA